MRRALPHLLAALALAAPTAALAASETPPKQDLRAYERPPTHRAQPNRAITETMALMLAVRPARSAIAGREPPPIRAREEWFSDEGFRFAKGRLAFKHRF